MFNLGLPLAIAKIFKRVFSLFIKKLYSRVAICGDFIEIRSGLIVRRRIFFKVAQIRCVSIEQTPFMQTFKLYTLRAIVAGEKSSRDKAVVLLPISGRKEAEERMKECFGSFLLREDMIYTTGRNWLRKKELYCPKENIGLIKISERVFKKGYKLKLKVRSQRACTVKARFPTIKDAQNHIEMYFCE